MMVFRCNLWIAKRHKLFLKQMLCTRTLYNYGRPGSFKNKIYRLAPEIKKKHLLKELEKVKMAFGKSIEERPLEIENRSSFGNWEIDTIVPKKNKEEPALITITERKTRMEIILKIATKNSSSVNESLEKLPIKT